MSEVAIESQETQKVKVDIKIPFKGKLGYGFGEMGGQLSFQLVSTYLTLYYTDVVGLAPAVIAGIMLFSRIWDAINDPMFGAITENTHSRWGRYRPYILFGGPILALFNILCFFNMDVSMGWKVAWCTLTYIGVGMAYTAVSVSIGAVANSMTSIIDERVLLNSYRGFIGNIGGVITSAVTMPLILFFGNGSTSSAEGYLYSAIIFSVISLPCFWLCFVTTKEVIGNEQSKVKRGSVLKAIFNSFKYAFKDRNATLLIIAMFLFLLGVFGRLGIMAYYFIYVLKDPTIIAGCATALTVGMMIPSLYTPILFRFVDKKLCGALAGLLQALCCVAFFFAGETGAIGSIVVISFIYGATNMGGAVAYALTGEIVDDSWLKTGVRVDGVLYSAVSFSTKLGLAVGGAVGIVALGAVGFVANTEMSESVLTNINAVINFGPAAIFLISMIPFLLIKMNNKLSKENEVKMAAAMNE